MCEIKSIHMNSLTTLVPIMNAVCLTISENFSTLIDKWNNLPPWSQFSCNKIQKKKKSTVTAFKWYCRVINSQERKLCNVFPRIVVATTILFWGSWCDNYSRETTIQGRKLLFSWVVSGIYNLNCCPMPVHSRRICLVW